MREPIYFSLRCASSSRGTWPARGINSAQIAFAGLTRSRDWQQQIGNSSPAIVDISRRSRSNSRSHFYRDLRGSLASNGRISTPGPTNPEIDEANGGNGRGQRRRDCPRQRGCKSHPRRRYRGPQMEDEAENGPKRGTEDGWPQKQNDRKDTRNEKYTLFQKNTAQY